MKDKLVGGGARQGGGVGGNGANGASGENVGRRQQGQEENIRKGAQGITETLETQNATGTWRINSEVSESTARFEADLTFKIAK